MTSTTEATFDCCPPFDPEPWKDKSFVWDNKAFIRDRVSTLFYMPVNFGKVIMRADARIRKAGAGMLDWMCLSDHTSLWNMDIYLATDREIADAENVTLSGSFYSRVYEGPFKDTGKWHKDFEAVMKAKGITLKKCFMWYTTCPKCAKKYGKNYVVIMGQIE